MGQGYVLKCSKCRYSLTVELGGGFMMPQITNETIEKMKSGAYGEKARKFFEENPDGTVDCDYVLLRCEKCGTLKVDMDLSLYKRKESASGKDLPWYMPDPEYYVKAEDFDHKCKKCGCSMHVVDTSDDFFEKIENGEINCPVCHGNLYIANILMWD